MDNTIESCSVVVASDSLDLTPSAEVKTLCAASIPDDEKMNNLDLPRDFVRQSSRISKESSIGSQPKLIDSCSLSHLFKGRRKIGKAQNGKSFRRDFEADIAPELTTSEQIAIPRPVRRPLKRHQGSDAIVREPLPSNLRANLLGFAIPNIEDETENSKDDFVPVSDDRLQKFCEKVMQGRKRREGVKDDLLHERCCKKQIPNSKYNGVNVEPSSSSSLLNQCANGEKKSPVIEEIPKTNANRSEKNKNDSVIKKCKVKFALFNEGNDIIKEEDLKMSENDPIPQEEIKEGMEDEFCVVPVRRCSRIADNDVPRIGSIESELTMDRNTENWNTHNSCEQVVPTMSNHVNSAVIESSSCNPSGMVHPETKSQSNRGENSMIVGDKITSCTEDRSNIKPERKVEPTQSLTRRVTARCTSPLHNMRRQGLVAVDVEKGKLLEEPIRLTLYTPASLSRRKGHEITNHGNAPKESSRDSSPFYRSYAGAQTLLPQEPLRSAGKSSPPQLVHLASLHGSPEFTKVEENSTIPHPELKISTGSPYTSPPRVTKLPPLCHHPKRLI
ncbi:uncharacterized protein TM35_000232320 [Trypanosoma theileri]|uniref:Uncharacterized protein n=1 Tax=Trypanosoma theileri TaxID=67003 RepID=A0A1X0NRN6_9TRYP|nr:uncharacterized protein TM35_000232320 [Trypanosoma theileri]ORC87261.1 hypothetical protein TM35_000232320 [Trypanosoma theileri]